MPLKKVIYIDSLIQKKVGKWCSRNFFVRHGQTDHNAGKVQGEHFNISLNETGLAQAEGIEPLIATLPLRMVFYSPMKRAKETKDIITRRISAHHLEMPEFTECSGHVWEELQKEKVEEPLTKQFIKRVKEGLQKILDEKGPVLIIAHGGVYSAIFTCLNLKGKKSIDNCVPVRFSTQPNGHWSVIRLDYILNEIK